MHDADQNSNHVLPHKTPRRPSHHEIRSSAHLSSRCPATWEPQRIHPIHPILQPQGRSFNPTRLFLASLFISTPDSSSASAVIPNCPNSLVLSQHYEASPVLVVLSCRPGLVRIDPEARGKGMAAPRQELLHRSQSRDQSHSSRWRASGTTSMQRLRSGHAQYEFIILSQTLRRPITLSCGCWSGNPSELRLNGPIYLDGC